MTATSTVFPIRFDELSIAINFSSTPWLTMIDWGTSKMFRAIIKNEFIKTFVFRVWATSWQKNTIYIFRNKGVRLLSTYIRILIHLKEFDCQIILQACWSVLEFWKIKLEKSSSTNRIFSMQKSISKLKYTGSRNQVRNRLNIQFVELDFSKLIFQKSSTDQQGARLLYLKCITWWTDS